MRSATSNSEPKGWGDDQSDRQCKKGRTHSARYTEESRREKRRGEEEAIRGVENGVSLFNLDIILFFNVKSFFW